MVKKKATGRKKRPKQKNKNKKDPTQVFVYVLFALLAFLLVAALLLYAKRTMQYRTYPPPMTPKAAPKKLLPKEPYVKKHPRPKEVVSEKRKPRFVSRVAIVIDDLGYNGGLEWELLNLDAPLTFSILPLAPYSKSLAKRANAMGRDVMLHLPMEPYKYPQKNPGNGTLLLCMSEEELIRKIEEDIKSVPGIIGVNNHMGSRFTEDQEKMEIVLKELRKRNLFFLDSRTTRETVGYSLAKSMGLKVAERNVFLDNDKDVTLIKNQIHKLAALSLKNGSAIGIGHPFPSTIEALKETIPELTAKGIEIVPVSQLLQ